MATVTKSVLSAKLGDKLKKAVNAHKNDEAKFDTGGSLPSGIENGVAQLVECKFDVIKPGAQNAGQPFFYAAGVIVSPDQHTDGTPLKGRRTSIMEVLFDTPTRSRKTVEDHVDWVMNQMRILGFDTTALDGSGEGLESAAAALKEAAPHFRFRTWQGQKQTTGPYAGREPRVQETWQGQCEWGDVTDAATGVQDDTPADDGSGVVDETPAEESHDEPASDAKDYAEMGLADLATECANGDDDAQAELTKRAVAAGFSEDEVTNAESWDAVMTMIEEKKDEPAEDPVPAKGDVYKYQVIDAKTKKPAMDPKTKKPAKPIEVEIQTVDKKTKTVTAKNLDTGKAITADGKTAMKIPFDSLIAV